MKPLVLPAEQVGEGVAVVVGSTVVVVVEADMVVVEAAEVVEVTGAAVVVDAGGQVGVTVLYLYTVFFGLYLVKVTCKRGRRSATKL
jgi:hypothetical protein